MTFFMELWLTDAYLCYTPSQIALADIIFSAFKAGITRKRYLSASLILKENRTYLSQ